MHTTGTHVAAKARKKPPMSNAQSLREKLQFGQINNFRIHAINAKCWINDNGYLSGLVVDR